MKGIILAAGRGSRMQGMTEDIPKCLIPLAGRPLLEYQLAALRQGGVTDVTVIGGYRAEKLEGRGARLLRNPDWESTNMVATLACAGDLLREDFILSYGDIVYRPGYVERLIGEPAGIAVIVDRRWLDLWRLRFADPYQDAETMVIDGQGRIRELGKRIVDPALVQGQYTGLLKFSGAGREAMLDLLAELGADGQERSAFAKLYMTDFLQRLIDRGVEVKAVMVENGWLEMDSDRDHDLYRDLAAAGRLAPFFDAAAYRWEPA